MIAHLEIGEDVRDGEHAGGSWSLCYWGLVVSFCRGSSDWNIGGARHQTLDAGTRHLCSAETEARLRHADTCYNVTIIAFISLKQGAGVQSPEQEGGLVTSHLQIDV